MCIADEEGREMTAEASKSTSEKEEAQLQLYSYREERGTRPDRTRASKSSSACSQTQPAPLAQRVSPRRPSPLLP